MDNTNSRRGTCLYNTIVAFFGLLRQIEFSKASVFDYRERNMMKLYNVYAFLLNIQFMYFIHKPETSMWKLWKVNKYFGEFLM